MLIAEATNLGLTRMAEACGISYDMLAWTQEWYVREETLRAANLAIVNYHQQLPLTAVFGGRHAVVLGRAAVPRPRASRSPPGRCSRYFADAGPVHLHPRHRPALHVRHQGHRRDRARRRHYVLDEILGNATDLPITEHATDTHGATLVNFALFDLVGKQLSPRIRDLGKITLYRTGHARPRR